MIGIAIRDTTAFINKTLNMDIVINITTYTMYTLIGYLIPMMARLLAGYIADPQLAAYQREPQKMLSVFYRSQALKLTVFTILCLLAMLNASTHSSFVILGIMSNSVFYLVRNNIKAYAKHPKYSN